jgi:hypothetical protein
METINKLTEKSITNLNSHNEYLRARSIERIEQMLIERGGICLNLETYKNNFSDLIWKCNLCNNKWVANFNNVYYKKSWCPKCRIGESENICRAILEYLFSDELEFINCRPHILHNEKTKKNLEFDCYNEKIALALEYQGIQHFKNDGFFNLDKSEEAQQLRIQKLEKQKNHDQIKHERSIKHGIKLIEITYLDRKRGISFMKWKIFNLIKEDLIKFKNSELFKTNINDNSLEINGINIFEYDTTMSEKMILLEKEFADWLNNDKIDIQKNILCVKRKNETIEFLKNLGAKLMDESIIITGYRHKFEVICKNGHVFETYMDNMINRKRWCLTCKTGKQFQNMRKVHKEVSNMDPSITVLDNEWKGVDTQMNYVCDCGYKGKRSLTSMRTKYRKHGDEDDFTICGQKPIGIHYKKIQDLLI